MTRKCKFWVTRFTKKFRQRWLWTTRKMKHRSAIDNLWKGNLASIFKLCSFPANWAYEPHKKSRNSLEASNLHGLQKNLSRKKKESWTDENCQRKKQKHAKSLREFVGRKMREQNKEGESKKRKKKLFEKQKYFFDHLNILENEIVENKFGVHWSQSISFHFLARRKILAHKFTKLHH